MTDDLISRADAIDAIARLHALNDEGEIRRAYESNPHSTMTDFEDTLVSAFDAIYDIPSAQPKLDEWCTDCKEYNHETHSCPRWNRVIRATVEEVKANNQPKTEEWIDCNEKLPEVGHDVMFSVADIYSAEGCLRDDGDWWQFRWSSIIPKDRVTAWMPLPQPYNGARMRETHDIHTNTHECVKKPKVKKPCANCEYHDWIWDEHFGYGSVCNGIGRCPYNVEETITSEQTERGE